MCRITTTSPKEKASCISVDIFQSSPAGTGQKIPDRTTETQLGCSILLVLDKLLCNPKNEEQYIKAPHKICVSFNSKH